MVVSVLVVIWWGLTHQSYIHVGSKHPCMNPGSHVADVLSLVQASAGFSSCSAVVIP